MEGILNYELLGNKIRDHRQANDLTQEKLSKMTDISISFIGHIERGTRKASVETLIRIVRSLDISMDELLSGATCDTLAERRIHNPIAHLNAIRRELDILENGLICVRGKS